MNAPVFDPTLDLSIERIIRANPASVWRAWTEPDLLAQWWTPAPTVTRVDALDVSPGGAFVTRMSDDGQAFVPHTDGIFIAVEPKRRLAFTNALTSQWRPATPAPVAMSAEITVEPHHDGTAYRAVVRHAAQADRDLHEALGFFDGWGAVTAALAALVESEDAP